MPLATHIRSGATPSCSHANIVPVRPKPIATSSQIEQHAVLVAQLAHRAQVAVRVHEHPRRALHERLDDDRRDALAVRLEQPAHVGRRRRARRGGPRTAAGGRSRGRGRSRRPRPSRSCRRGRRRAGRRTRSAALAAQLPVLVGHLHRDLGGGRAVVGVEDALQPGRRDRHQPRRQLRRAGMREAEHRRVRDAVELRLDGGVDGRVAVAVDGAPQRRDAVDVGVAVGVVERAALGALDHQRRLLLPAALLRERVPDVRAVELGEGGGVHARTLARRRSEHSPSPYWIGAWGTAAGCRSSCSSSWSGPRRSAPRSRSRG